MRLFLHSKQCKRETKGREGKETREGESKERNKGLRGNRYVSSDSDKM